MAKKIKKKTSPDLQQENVNDPVFVPDLSKIKGLSEKLSIEGARGHQDVVEYSAVLESICGAVDDSQPVESYDGSLGVTSNFVNSHERPVGVLRWNSNLASIYDNPGNVAGQRWCTGTLISNNLFLTAGHCFDQTGGGWVRPKVNGTNNIIPVEEIALNMRVEFNFQARPDGSLRTPDSVEIEELLEYRLGNLDFAIVRLAGSPGTDFGFTRFAANDGDTGDMICIIGHPAGMPKRIEAGPITRFEGDRVRYNDIDTMGGNSGSGILRGSDGRIVGIHTNGGCNVSGTGSNFGVKISALRRESATIRDLDDSVTTRPTLDNGIKQLLDRGTNFFNDRHTSIFRDTATHVVLDRRTSVLADRITSTILDRPTSPFTDRNTSLLADNRGTDVRVDNPGNPVKGISDRKIPGIGGRLGNRFTQREAGVRPFVLCTPHHAPGLGESTETGDQSLLESYEAALADLEHEIEVTAANYDSLVEYYTALLEEAEQLLEQQG